MTELCQHCGVEMAPSVHANRRYCGPVCRVKAFRAAKRAAYPARKCRTCGADFTPARRDKRCCGTACAAKRWALHSVLNKANRYTDHGGLRSVKRMDNPCGDPTIGHMDSRQNNLDAAMCGWKDPAGAMDALHELLGDIMELDALAAPEYDDLAERIFVTMLCLPTEFKEEPQ